MQTLSSLRASGRLMVDGVKPLVVSWPADDMEQTECDIVVYEKDGSNDYTRWVSDGAPVSLAGEYSIRRVFVHEMGHCLGLAHQEDEDSIMWFEAFPDLSVSRADLTEDGVEAIIWLYGAKP